ncbi:MAG: trypsin-like peptidase domain-containing protein, partial [Planctomycetes bacterium]|nr:trypsin-like peptidase domain-containing protein [Planctomycetota bacterium]
MARWSVPLVCLLAGGSLGLFLADPVLHGQNPPVNQVVPPVTGIPKELASYHPIVEKILPAVVSIETKFKTKAKKDQSSRGSNPLDNQDVPEDLRKFLQQFDQRQFQEDETPHFGFGSGVLADPKGVVLTAAHVVSDADQVEVTLMDGRKFTSHDIHADLKTDLAIVRLDAKAGPFPYLELGDSDAMQIGDRVLAVGAPFGLTGSVTSGIVSAKGRSGFRMNMYEDFIQTDAAINPGNSGGPLLDSQGNVLGINTAILGSGNIGIGFAMPINRAKMMLDDFQAGRKPPRLGVSVVYIAGDYADALELPAQ